MSDPTLEEMLGLERQVWDALVDGDPEADGALLSDAFLGVYASGFGDRAEHMEQLSRGPTVATYRLSEARLMILSPDLALLVYHATYRRAARGAAPGEEQMYVSSLWRRGSEGWRNIFSQDTEAGGPRPV